MNLCKTECLQISQRKKLFDFYYKPNVEQATADNRVQMLNWV